MSVSKSNYITTPAFIIDEQAVNASLKTLVSMTEETGSRLLYSLKAYTGADFLKMIVNSVQGFSVSSYFEARLAHEIIGSNGSVHFTSPGLHLDEIKEVSQWCNYISFNSLSQWRRLCNYVLPSVSQGLRINPKIQIVADERYDPCRKYSKLGIDLNLFINEYFQNFDEFAKIDGIHFHNNCSDNSAETLFKVVNHICEKAGEILKNLKWINIGGGYVFSEMENLTPAIKSIDRLRQEFGLEVFMEPGFDIVNNAGIIVASVIDIFKSDEKTLAVLDTTVNHMPEVFEYQYQPYVLESEDNAPNSYLLAGSSCLAGDIFGEYSFKAPLEIGSRLTFTQIGAYSMVKASMFNGINMPNIYTLTATGECRLIMKYTYDDFIKKWGNTKSEIV